MDIQKEKLYKSAVDAALDKDWTKAIDINKRVILLDPQFIDSYLCIGYAYLQKGDLKNSKKFYREALKLDPNNIIARNNIDKINILIKKGELLERESVDDVPLDPNTFINIRGKTKNITLLNTGQPDVLAKLKVGEKVYLVDKKRRIEVRNKKSEYIGVLPDDVSRRLIFLLNAKSKYLTFIKSAGKNSVEIFIKEEKKGPKVKHFISFPANIQDDLKLFTGKSDDEEKDEIDHDSLKTTYGEHNDEEDSAIEDIEELANEREDDKEDYYSDIPSHHDDFEE